VELLKQGQYQPMSVVDQVLSIYAGTRGHLDAIPRDQVAAWEKGFLAFMREQKPEIRNKIVETKDLDDAAAAQLESAIKEYQGQFSGQQSQSRQRVAVMA
jgi:F-type H+-transporting ATPase subunit alpha